MSKEDFSEKLLIEQPAIGLFGELEWETANCYHGFEHAGRSPLGRDIAGNDRRLAIPTRVGCRAWSEGLR
jgi:hypothetical protein